MESGISPALLLQLSSLIESLMGLSFPPERWGDLERRLQAAAPTFACSDGEACARFLTSSALTKRHIELLAAHLTVGETYFFREPRSFEVLEEHILPQLIDARRGTTQHLRLWSAACCTGEEPYSLAILLHRVLANLPAWSSTILATDLSPRFLQKAAAGVYGRWSFRNVPTWVQERYFCKNLDNHYAIHPSLQEMVHFAQLNLAADAYPSITTETQDMDVIFCRNVLIYFTNERARQVIENLYHALTDGGWLVVSPVETAYVLDSPFTAVQFPGVTLFRKTSQPRTSFFLEKDLSAPVPVQSTPAFEPPCVTDSVQPVAAAFALPQANAEEIGQESAEAACEKGQSEEGSAPGPALTAYEEACALYTQGRYIEVTEKLLTQGRAKEREHDAVRNFCEQEMALLARAYANQGQLDSAQTWCERALAANKFDAKLHYLRATILLEQGQVAEARLSLTRALYLDQHFILAHFALGNLARQNREFKEAHKHFANAQALLEKCPSEGTLAESDGMTAGRLAQIIAEMTVRS